MKAKAKEEEIMYNQIYSLKNAISGYFLENINLNGF